MSFLVVNSSNFSSIRLVSVSAHEVNNTQAEIEVYLTIIYDQKVPFLICADMACACK